MSDRKTETSTETIRTPLLSREKSNNKNTFRVKLLHADRQQSIGKHNTPQPPPTVDTDPEPVTEGKTGKKSLFWAVGYGLVFSMLTVAGIHLFRSDPAPTSSTKEESIHSGSIPADSHVTNKPPQEVLDRTIDISDIVANITKDTIWDVQKIHYLNKNWMQLDSERQWEVSREKWFQAFLNALQQQLNLPANSTQLSKEQLIVRSTTLLELQELLNHVPAPQASPKVVHANTPRQVVAHAESAQKSLKDDTREIQKPTPKPLAKKTSTHQTAAGKPPQDTNTPVAAPTTDTVPKKQSPDSDIPMVTVAETASTQAQTGTVAKTSIDKDANTNKRNNATPAARPTQETAKVAVSKTAEPPGGQTTLAKSSTSQDPLPAGNPVKDLPRDVAVEKKPPEKKKYYYVNGSIESLRKNKPQGKITVSELNDLLFELSNSYERGDLTVFGSLFNKDANDENYNTLKKTEKKFEQWLSNTSDRQMFLNDFNWAFNKNVAIGTGKLSLTLITENDPRIVTIKKAVELTVRKDQGKVRITKFQQSDL